MLSFISAAILPAMIFVMILYGVIKKVHVYDTFIDGAKDGLKIVIDIMPTLIGLIVAVGVLRASSFFELLGRLFKPLLDKLNIAVEVFTLSIIKMFSSSASRYYKAPGDNRAHTGGIFHQPVSVHQQGLHPDALNYRQRQGNPEKHFSARECGQ